jgi:TPR repeat protein
MQKIFSVLGLFGIVFCSFFGDPTIGAERVALVIGNGAYRNYDVLLNPANDAKAVSAALRRADFEVIEGYDLTRIDFDAVIRRFLGEIERGRVALVYYSGHGVQVDGRNFMLPVDVVLETPYDLDSYGVDVGKVLGYMQHKAETQLVFLDACRNNPFSGRAVTPADTLQRGVLSRGLASMPAATGSLVAFATDPGNVALDGVDALSLSPFTSAFTKLAVTPALEVRRMLTQVRREVMQVTRGAQVPWENSALLGDFFFVAARKPPIVQPVYAVSRPSDGSPITLNIPEPSQPEGGALFASFNQLPKLGRLMLNATPLAPGERIPAAQLPLVALQAEPGSTATEPISYTVYDNWGNETTAWVVVTLTPSLSQNMQSHPSHPGDETAERRELTSLAERFARAGSAAPIAVPGVGPIALNLALPDDAARGRLVRVEIAGQEGVGGFWIGRRRLGQGDTLDVAELKEIAYAPELSIAAKPGYERQAKLTLRLVSPGFLRSDPWPIPVKTIIHDCDRLAAEPLDLQGVAEGVLANQIAIADAEKACLSAIARYPQVARFYHQLGRVYQARGQARQAADLFTVADAKGHIRASYALGLLEANGASGSPDLAKAIGAFRKAADSADPFAMHALGKRLYAGYGIKQDRRAGFSLMVQAAAMGHTFSMNELGAIFTAGEGVSKDLERALTYYKASAERNDIFGFNNLALMLLDGAGTVKNPQVAQALFMKAHEGGHPDAAGNIGRMYFNGLGVAKDLKQAALWYERSAIRGNPWAANNRAWIALHGPPELRDAVAAARYYALGAVVERGAWSAQARSEAQRELAKLPAEAKIAASQAIGRDLKLATPVKPNAGDLTSALAAAKIRPTGSHPDAVLLDLTHLAWLRSKPRFDLF